MSPAPSSQRLDWTLKSHGPGTHFPSPSFIHKHPTHPKPGTPSRAGDDGAESRATTRGQQRLGWNGRGTPRPQGGWGWGCQKMEYVDGSWRVVTCLLTLNSGDALIHSCMQPFVPLCIF